MLPQGGKSIPKVPPGYKSPSDSDNDGDTSHPRVGKSEAHPVQQGPSQVVCRKHCPCVNRGSKSTATDDITTPIQSSLNSINGRLATIEATIAEMSSLLKSLTPSMPRTIATRAPATSGFLRRDI